MRPWRFPSTARTAGPHGVTSVARSHVGLVRQFNEDRVFDCSARRLWAIADGMGGHSGGDLAAQTIVNALRAVADEKAAISVDDMVRGLQDANRTIAQRNVDCVENAGSTVVAMHLADSIATIAWVGDSRAYLIRDGIILLTHDHSVVQELIDAGLLTVPAAAGHPSANIVTRALGVAQGVEIATTTVDVQAGDRLLLCSDGLSRSLAADVPRDLTLDQLADKLLAMALHKDGSDNISLVLVDVFAQGGRNDI